MKFLNDDEKRNYSLNNFPTTSTAHNSKQNPRIKSNHHKRFSLNENSIDADNIDVSFAFHDFDKYSDDIWRKTVSSDCEQSIAVWEKQPEAMANWGTGNGIYEPAPRSSVFFENDRDIFSTGGNFFYPTSSSAATNNWGESSSARKLTTGGETKASNRKKHHSNRGNSTSIDSDDELQTIKKRLSLSSLRNSLCRQKALENLNNENQNQSSTSGSNNNATVSVNSDDFLQVFIFFF